MYKVITPVATEPVLLEEAKAHLRVDIEDDDDLIEALITAAREFAEHYTGRALAPQTLEMALSDFPSGCDSDYIDLDMPPAASVTSIKYTDAAGVEQTLPTSDYPLSLYGDARRVSPAYGATWPAVQDIADAVRIRYVTGYETAPKAVKSAILIHVQMQYDPLTPAQKEALGLARDSLLNTVKMWGR